MFFYDEYTLHIANFKRILYVDLNKISILQKNITLNISGENLKIIELNDDDLYIQGKINNIELKDNE